MSYAEAIDVYLAAARRKREQGHRELLLREERAWEAARSTAVLLKE